MPHFGSTTFMISMSEAAPSLTCLLFLLFTIETVLYSALNK